MSEYVCPHCKKPIYDDDVLLCLYCGNNLNRSVGFMSKIKYPTPRIIIVIAIIIISLSFIILVTR